MKHIILIIGLTISGISLAQNSVDYLAEAKKFDFSDLWTLDSILIENDKLIERRQPLGFIGENFQRINIKFISVIQNPNNHLQYMIYGKTRVKGNICDFQGTLTISGAEMYIESDLPPLKQGYITGYYSLYEDKDQTHTGFFSGKFKTHFYFNEKGKLQYDALSWAADGFENNQFEGSWTDYKTGVIKKCNWGDYRIPDSRKLDTGAAEFGVDQQYYDFGWKYYNLAWGYSLDKPGVKEARERETEKWWIENK
jgi:hypothetical protein